MACVVLGKPLGFVLSLVGRLTVAECVPGCCRRSQAGGRGREQKQEDQAQAQEQSAAWRRSMVIHACVVSSCGSAGAEGQSVWGMRTAGGRSSSHLMR